MVEEQCHATKVDESAGTEVWSSRALRSARRQRRIVGTARQGVAPRAQLEYERQRREQRQRGNDVARQLHQ